MEGWKGDRRVDISLSHTARSTLRYFFGSWGYQYHGVCRSGQLRTSIDRAMMLHTERRAGKCECKVQYRNRSLYKNSKAGIGKIRSFPPDC